MIDTVYVVKLMNSDKASMRDWDTLELARKLLKKNTFKGILVNQSATHFYFDNGQDKNLVIVPHRLIEFMTSVPKEGE